jgi:large subunit ribosomal protein L29
MKASELRNKNTDELRQELKELLRAQFSLRMQIATQQTNKTHELRQVRRDIARVRTVLHAMKLKSTA